MRRQKSQKRNAITLSLELRADERLQPWRLKIYWLRTARGGWQARLLHARLLLLGSPAGSRRSVAAMFASPAVTFFDSMMLVHVLLLQHPVPVFNVKK